MATVGSSHTSIYQPGDRVWVKVEPFDWWPARVLSNEEMADRGIARSAGHNITVMFYAGESTGETYEHFNTATANITYFETSSEKAVTPDPDCQAAVRRAAADATANPVKYELAAGLSMNAGAGNSDFGAANAVSRKKTSEAVKRSRDDADNFSDTGSSYEGGDGHRRRPTVLMPESWYVELTSRIQGAADADDVPELRAALCELENIEVPLSILKSSKIGVAVGNTLGKKSLMKLWPLARALITSWFAQVPEETREVIKLYREQTLTQKQQPADAMVDPASPTVFGSPSYSTIEQLPDVPKKKSFAYLVQELLDNPADPPVSGMSPEKLRQVAVQLSKEISSADDRRLLMDRLKKPGLVNLRRGFVSGTITAQEYLKMPPSALQTEEEKEAEELRITIQLEEQEKAKKANMSVTSLFKCPECEKNNCTFFEKQIRSADEPTTKFITCLECQFTWTME